MDESNYMQDAEGRMVPVDKVRPEHKLEDQMVNELLAQAKHHNNRLSDFKVKTFDDIHALMDLLAEKYQVKRGGKKAI